MIRFYPRSIEFFELGVSKPQFELLRIEIDEQRHISLTEQISQRNIVIFPARIFGGREERLHRQRLHVVHCLSRQRKGGHVVKSIVRLQMVH